GLVHDPAATAVTVAPMGRPESMVLSGRSPEGHNATVPASAASTNGARSAARILRRRSEAGGGGSWEWLCACEIRGGSGESPGARGGSGESSRDRVLGAGSGVGSAGW